MESCRENEVNKSNRMKINHNKVAATFVFTQSGKFNGDWA